MDVFLGSMLLVAFDFAPAGFALCQGQLLPISSNTALFALLGTNFGGDGKSTFGLPNLQGALAVSQGQAPGMNAYTIGESGGNPTVTLTVAQVPAHQHSVLAAKGGGNNPAPSGNALAQSAVYGSDASNTVTFNSAALGAPIGGGQPHNNLMPYATLNWVIALRGVFPPRS